MDIHVKLGKCDLFTPTIIVPLPFVPFRKLSQQLAEKSIPFVRIDGSCSIADRCLAVKTLENDPFTRVLLLSLIAGGTGLNLVAANHVIMVEPNFNPMNEDQAADRVYRVNQRKDVHIYKLICDDTLEQHVCNVQVGCGRHAGVLNIPNNRCIEIQQEQKRDMARNIIDTSTSMEKDPLALQEFFLSVIKEGK